MQIDTESKDREFNEPFFWLFLDQDKKLSYFRDRLLDESHSGDSTRTRLFQNHDTFLFMRSALRSQICQGLFTVGDDEYAIEELEEFVRTQE